MTPPRQKRTGGRAAFGTAWWAVAFRESVESQLGSRAAGGRRYARSGAVEWLDARPGEIRGGVRGSGASDLDEQGVLYEPVLELATFDAAEQGILGGVLARHPHWVARVLAGEMPEELAAELAPHEVSLLPRGASEFSFDCSCLDWPGPCRHVAALVYATAARLDDEPLMLFTVRGVAPTDLPDPGADPAGGAVSAPEAAGGPEADGPAVGLRALDGASGTPGTGATAWDPELLDLGPVRDVLGDEAAAALAAFYRPGR
jgi:uncharacterized Zn finger protein